MSRLLVAALNALYLGAVRDGALTVAATPSDLATSVAKQLQQGKLVESLPTISEAAAADLSVLPAPTELAEQLLDPRYEVSGSSDCQPLLLSSSSLQAAQRHAAQLLDVLTSFKHLWAIRQYADVIAPLRHTAAMEVAPALIRSISYCLEHFPPTLLQPPGFLNALLECACLIAWSAAEEWQAQAGRDRTPYSPLLWSRHCLPCLAISIMVMSYATLLQEEQPAARGDDARIRDAWQLANSQQDVLPVSHDELLALLGCSSKTVIFAAALLHLEAKQRITAMTMTVHMFCTALTETPKPNPERQQDPEPLPQQTRYAIAFLLPTMLLHWAAQYPGHRLMYDSVCSCACCGSNSGWMLLQQHQQTALADLLEEDPAGGSTAHTSGGSQQQQQQQQGQGAAAATAAASGPWGPWGPVGATAAVAASQQLLPAHKDPALGLADWLASLHPLAVSESVEFTVKLLKAMLLQLQRLSSSSGGSSSSSSSSGGSGQCQELCRAIDSAVRTITAADECVSTAVAAQAAVGRPNAAFQQLVVSAWQQHCGEMWTALESYVRWQARSHRCADRGLYRSADARQRAIPSQGSSWGSRGVWQQWPSPGS